MTVTYKLNGEDSDKFSIDKNGKLIQLNKLPPGEYRISIEAVNQPVTLELADETLLLAEAVGLLKDVLNNDEPNLRGYTIWAQISDWLEENGYSN